MMRVFDYKCPDGHVSELFVDLQDTDTQKCQTCGQVAQRQLSAPAFVLEGHSGHFPSRASKWEREHEKAGRKQ